MKRKQTIGTGIVRYPTPSREDYFDYLAREFRNFGRLHGQNLTNLKLERSRNCRHLGPGLSPGEESLCREPLH